ncbi:MAG: PhoX family phosphatase [Pyrinomonadaceae bacterium]
MASSDDGMISNTSGNRTIHEVIESRVSRRSFLRGVSAATVAGALTVGAGGLASIVPVLADGRRHRPLLGFQSIAPGFVDDLVVPPGYNWEVLISWGDPVSDGPSFKHDASNTAVEQAEQWGMHNDGIVYFPFDRRYGDRDDEDHDHGNGRGHGNDDDNDDRGRDRSSRHGLIVQNNEYTDDVLLFRDGLANWNSEKTKKSQNAHGVSVIEVKQRHGCWEVVRPSSYARRITGQSAIKIGGPAAGDDRLRTSSDPSGRRVLGTFNNCAMGYTPWGTYLACEENFNGYFLRENGQQTQSEKRYGIGSSSAYLWHTTDTRFKANVEPNEPNRFGWVVEIDPFDPHSTPVKRTAIGRFKHEGAWVQEARDGRVVVYSGDDEQFEYIYRYVSKDPWRKMIKRGKSPLDEGTLYVARFDPDPLGDSGKFRGVWLPLTPGNPALAAATSPSTGQLGWTLNDILINTRTASDIVGATPMDRPEWIDTFPDTLTGIATLTNNTARGPQTTVNPRTSVPYQVMVPPFDVANPRSSNTFGHIIRWSYRRDRTENTFAWDIFALAGDPDPSFPVPDDGSNIVGDKYGSPDGIYVAPSGRLWIQTDVSGSSISPLNNPRTGPYGTYGNNQMLCADPVTKETRRFLTGPHVSEITGVFVTPDEKTMFVGIQHPGEAPSGNNDPLNPRRYSTWPDANENLDPNDVRFGRPRSSLIVIRKDNGGVIGS